MWSVVPGRTDKIAHAIETGTCRPVRQPSYRIPQVYKAEVQKMRQAGVIVPSTSEWSFPIVPVRKKDGSLCICIDYRRLNCVVSWRCQLEMRIRCKLLVSKQPSLPHLDCFSLCKAPRPGHLLAANELCDCRTRLQDSIVVLLIWTT